MTCPQAVRERITTRMPTCSRGDQLLLWIAVAVLLPCRVAAQDLASVMAHAGQAGPRPLAERLELADAAVLARIEAVAPGRIQLAEIRVLSGHVDPEAQVKRSASRPPALEKGDRALLLLRGARSPYILVDRPDEVVRLDGDESWERWGAAIEALVAESDGDALLGLYASWLEGTDDGLRDEAARALSDSRTSPRPLPPDFVAARVALATAPGAGHRVRAASAIVALQTPEGTELLLRAMPGDAGAAPSGVLAMSLQAGLTLRSPLVLPALARALEHPDRGVRLAALRSGAMLSFVAESRDALVALAQGDPDPEVRALANGVLRRVHRNGGAPSGL